MNFIMEHAPIIGLLFFFFAFWGIVFSITRPGAKERLEKLSKIPLEGE